MPRPGGVNCPMQRANNERQSRAYTVRLAVCAALSIAAPFAAAAEVYKWTDERGVVNYSNDPPPKSAARQVAVVPDRLSVYTPDKDVVQAMQGARERRAAAASRSPGRSGDEERRPRESVAVIAPALPPHPCANAADPGCYGYSLYDNSPVFWGRQGVPHLVQPELAPGAIAGSVARGGYTPGLSTQAQSFAPGRARDPRASLTLKDERGTRPHRVR